MLWELRNWKASDVLKALFDHGEFLALLQSRGVFLLLLLLLGKLDGDVNQG